MHQICNLFIYIQNKEIYYTAYKRLKELTIFSNTTFYKRI